MHSITVGQNFERRYSSFHCANGPVKEWRAWLHHPWCHPCDDADAKYDDGRGPASALLRKYSLVMIIPVVRIVYTGRPMKEVCASRFDASSNTS